MPTTDSTMTTDRRVRRLRRVGRVVGPTGFGISVVIHGALAVLAFALVVAAPVIELEPAMLVDVSVKQAAQVDAPPGPVAAVVGADLRPVDPTPRPPQPVQVEPPPQARGHVTMPRSTWHDVLDRVNELATAVEGARAEHERMLEAQREQARIEQARIAAEQAEQERLERERAEQERIARERAERAERERIEREIAEREQRVREQQEAGQRARERALAELDFRALVSDAVDEATVYPKRALRRGQEGRVVVRFALARDGSLIGEVVVVEPCGYDTLNAAAVEAVRDAAPVQGFPETLTHDRLEFEIAIVYELRE